MRVSNPYSFSVIANNDMGMLWMSLIIFYHMKSVEGRKVVSLREREREREQ